MGGVTGADGDAPEQQTPGQQTPGQQAEQTMPGFGERGRMRRRARFLRKARELAYRDLGGLVFDLHRFGQRNDQVLSAKLATLTQMDAELRALEKALDTHQAVIVLREVGIAACPRCAAIHGRDDRFCPGCGLPFDANAERPLATSPTGAHGLMPGPATQPTGALPASPTPSAPGAPAPADASTASSASDGPSRSDGPSPGMPSTSPSAPPTSASASAPPPKPTAPPVAAPKPREEDEPTQILHPPMRGAQG